MGGKATLRSARIGRINYINTIPFYHDLLKEQPNTVILEGSPAKINHLISTDQVDIAPISSLEYALHQDRYVLFPDLCIGSRDFARSVLLLSKERIEGLNHEDIVLTDKSFSSQALLKILLKYKYEFENKFIVSKEKPDEMLELGKAVLTIGDEALFYKPKEFVYKYDLSELWWDWTHLPFCFSVWAVRKEFYKENSSAVLKFYKLLKENTERNLQDLEALIRDSLSCTIADDRFASIFGYLFNLTYFLDEQMLKGLQHYYDLAHQAGLVPQVNQIHFFEVGK